MTNGGRKQGSQKVAFSQAESKPQGPSPRPGYSNRQDGPDVGGNPDAQQRNPEEGGEPRNNENVEPMGNKTNRGESQHDVPDVAALSLYKAAMYTGAGLAALGMALAFLGGSAALGVLLLILLAYFIYAKDHGLASVNAG